MSTVTVQDTKGEIERLRVEEERLRAEWAELVPQRRALPEVPEEVETTAWVPDHNDPDGGREEAGTETVYRRDTSLDEPILNLALAIDEARQRRRELQTETAR